MIGGKCPCLIYKFGKNHSGLKHSLRALYSGSSHSAQLDTYIIESYKAVLLRNFRVCKNICIIYASVSFTNRWFRFFAARPQIPPSKHSVTAADCSRYTQEEFSDPSASERVVRRSRSLQKRIIHSSRLHDRTTDVLAGCQRGEETHCIRARF